MGLLVFWAAGVAAQGTAPMPYGTWATKPASEQFFISSGGCRFYGNNGVTSVLIEGECSWDKPTTIGGILTIMNIHAYKTAPVYYSVVWVNAKTIKVNGDTFYKQN
jgi:hypothetical protein